jgi:hypothetical protein
VDPQTVFTGLSIVLPAIGYRYYVPEVIKRKTPPPLSTWISWFLMDVALIWTMWPKISPLLVVYFAGCCAMLVAYWRARLPFAWKTMDTVCLLIVVISLGFYFVSGNPEIAIGLILLAMTVSSGPLIVELYHHPEAEPIAPWMLIGWGASAAVAAVQKVTFVDAGPAICFLVLSVVFLALIGRQKDATPIRTEVQPAP